MRTIIISILFLFTACGRAPCEKESFGHIEFDNQTLNNISIQITITDKNEIKEVLPDFTLNSGLTKTVEVPAGLIDIVSEPGGSIDLGLLKTCETKTHVFDFILEVCGTCELVTEDSDGNITYGTPLPFCGDALEDKQNSIPVTIGGVTTYWDCY